MAVKVITDSTASLPEDLAAKHGVVRVPAWLVIGGREVREPEVTAAEVLERWDEGVSTSVPSPEDFAAAIAQADEGDGIVVLTVSSSLTGINRSAEMAAGLVGHEKVTVIDTGTGVGAHALIVLAAAEAADAGATIAETAAAAAAVQREVRLVATLGDLDHLARSGRVPGIARWAGRQVNLNAIVELGGGKVHVLRPAFDRRSALSRLVARVKRNKPESGARLHVTAFHSLEPAPAQEVLNELVSQHDTAESFIGEFSPAMVAHAGPGVVGVSWWWEPGAA